ncbi:hypothetical protein [Litchfieldia alkalitelluris]|nr:hypothetical protein [Litchfieldia alkalitelluris]
MRKDDFIINGDKELISDNNGTRIIEHAPDPHGRYDQQLDSDTEKDTGEN